MGGENYDYKPTSLEDLGSEETVETTNVETANVETTPVNPVEIDWISTTEGE